MDFESTPPKAPDAAQDIDLKTALAAIQLDIPSAEVALTRTLKKILAGELYSIARLVVFKDLDHPGAVANSMWVRKCSVGFDDSYLRAHYNWLEQDLRVWIGHIKADVLQHIERSGKKLVLIDGLRVKVQKVSTVAYSLSLSLSYSYEDSKNG